MNCHRQPAILLAALATGAAVLVLTLTEGFSPSGSPWAPLVIAGLAAAHLPLLHGRGVPMPRLPISANLVSIAAGVFLLAAAFTYVWNGEQAIFREPLSPFGNAQLGLMTETVARLQQQEPLYTKSVNRGSYEQEISFPAGAAVPFAVARLYGLDWRFASLASIVAVAALLLAAITRTNNPWAPAAIAAAGAAWLLVPLVGGIFHWLHAIVLWPFIAGLGLSLAARWNAMAALCAGILAAMNPGWIVLLPLVAACLYKDSPRRFPALLVLMIFWPLIAYGAYRAHFGGMAHAILGSIFSEGKSLGIEQSWRFASLAGLGDLANLRPLVYTMGLLGLALLAREILRREKRRERLSLLAFGAFLAIACGPASAMFHWMAHGILLSALIPVYTSTRETARPRSIPAIAAFATAAAGIALIALGAVRPRQDTVTPGQRVPANEHLISGFHFAAPDHVWGSSTRMAIGLPLHQPKAGYIDLELGTLPGDFTPINPTRLYVNGIERGVYLEMPGRSSHARIPLKPADLHIGYNFITLEASWLRTPKSYNAGNDSRPVSIMYRGMTYIPEQ